MVPGGSELGLIKGYCEYAGEFGGFIDYGKSLGYLSDCYNLS
jgi:hypothetical protein